MAFVMTPLRHQPPFCNWWVACAISLFDTSSAGDFFVWNFEICHVFAANYFFWTRFAFKSSCVLKAEFSYLLLIATACRQQNNPTHMQRSVTESNLFSNRVAYMRVQKLWKQRRAQWVTDRIHALMREWGTFWSDRHTSKRRAVRKADITSF